MFKETLQLKNKTIPFYLENLELILIHDSKLELSALDSLNQLSTHSAFDLPVHGRQLHARVAL